MNNKPKFDPSKPFSAVDKPPFDPSKGFDVPSENSRSIEAFGQGMAQGGTLGYANELQAATYPAVEKFMDFVTGGNVADINPEDTYAQRLLENKKRDTELRKSGAYLPGEIAGTLATSFIPGKIVSPATGAIGRLSQAIGTGGAMGYLQNPLEGQTREENALYGMGMGAAGHALASGVGYGAKALSGASESLGDFAEKNALRAAGAQKPQVKKLNVQNRAKEVGRFIIDEDLVKPGMDAQDILEKTRSVRNDAGAQISEAFDKIEKSGKGGVFNRKEIANQMRQSANEAIGNSLDAEQVAERLDKYISNFEKKEGPATARELLGLKGQFDERINYSRKAMDLPEIQDGYKALRTSLNDAINQRAENLSNKVRGDIGKSLKEANKRYSLASSVNEIAENKAAMEGNKFLSLTDTIAGAGGAAAGLAGGGLTAIPSAIGAAAANKALRTYGPAIGTKLLDKASKVSALSAKNQARLNALQRNNPIISGSLAARLKALGD